MEHTYLTSFDWLISVLEQRTRQYLSEDYNRSSDPNPPCFKTLISELDNIIETETKGISQHPSAHAVIRPLRASSRQTFMAWIRHDLEQMKELIMGKCRQFVTQDPVNLPTYTHLSVDLQNITDRFISVVTHRTI